MVHPLNRTVSWRFSLSSQQVQGPLLGVEIECEGSNLPASFVNYWNVHRDDSLREHGGPPREYTFKAPYTLNKTIRAIQYLNRKFEQAGVVLYEESPRTSVHVHLNVSDLTAMQVFLIVYLYTLYEEALVEWCGPYRVANLFCLRAVDTQYNMTALASWARDNDIEGINSDHRYAACNLSALRKFGTLEFRAMRGTTDEQTLTEWCNLFVNIRNIVTSGGFFRTPREMFNFFRDMRNAGASGPAAFHKLFLEKYQGPMPTALKPSDSLFSSMWRGHRLFSPVVGATKWPQKEDTTVNTDGASFNDVWVACLGSNHGPINAAISHALTREPSALSHSILTPPFATLAFDGRTTPLYVQKTGEAFYRDGEGDDIGAVVSPGEWIMYVKRNESIFYAVARSAGAPDVELWRIL